MGAYGRQRCTCLQMGWNGRHCLVWRIPTELNLVSVVCVGGGGVVAVSSRTHRTSAPPNTVERYLVLEGQRQKLIDMLHERWMPGATMWNGCLTVVGGENAEGVASTVEICDEVDGVWEEVPPPLRFAQNAPSVVANGGLMMVVGGFAVCPPLYTWGQVAATEQYDLGTYDLEEGCWKLCRQSKD